MSVTCFYQKKNLNSYSCPLNLHYKELSKLFRIPYSALINRQLLHEWSSMYNSLHCRISIVFGFLAPIKELFPELGYWRNRHPKVHYNNPYFIPCSRNGPSESTSNNSTHVPITKVRFMESTIYLLQFSCLLSLDWCHRNQYPSFMLWRCNPILHKRNDCSFSDTFYLAYIFCEFF